MSLDAPLLPLAPVAAAGGQGSGKRAVHATSSAETVAALQEHLPPAPKSHWGIQKSIFITNTTHTVSYVQVGAPRPVLHAFITQLADQPCPNREAVKALVLANIAGVDA